MLFAMQHDFTFMISCGKIYLTFGFLFICDIIYKRKKKVLCLQDVDQFKESVLLITQQPEVIALVDQVAHISRTPRTL